ncbi:hypothetical protein B0H13DRAFT_1981357 [Mycena leptocephala]|nr:hypothetical protein B0H13DRAFT_1981357 [Mycena leptocephala]
MNMFLGGAAPHAQPEVRFAPYIRRRCVPNRFWQASSSKSSSESAPASKPAPTESVAQREARELEEAIRMSLAESHSTANTTTESVSALFGIRIPTTLDFSTSRTSSPSRALTGTAGDESAVARLSYSATNQPVRYYHQALSGLLARLDAVDSFGDEGLRHTRKEVVGRVEGALDEVEKVVDARWRKFTGKAERSESAPIALPVESEAQPAPTVAEESPVVEEAPVVVTAEDVAPVDQDAPVELVVEAVPEATATPAVPEPAPEVESPSSYPPSVETLRPAVSPAPSDIDTFLLPATTDEQPVKKPRVKDDVEEVGSDWSEVDA